MSADFPKEYSCMCKIGRFHFSYFGIFWLLISTPFQVPILIDTIVNIDKTFHSSQPIDTFLKWMQISHAADSSKVDSVRKYFKLGMKARDHSYSDAICGPATIKIPFSTFPTISSTNPVRPLNFIRFRDDVDIFRHPFDGDIRLFLSNFRHSRLLPTQSIWTRWRRCYRVNIVPIASN